MALDVRNDALRHRVEAELEPAGELLLLPLRQRVEL